MYDKSFFFLNVCNCYCLLIHISFVQLKIDNKWLSDPLLLSHTFIALNLKPTLHENICLLPYIMWRKKFIFINATQKFVLLNYCMQWQVTWQPLLCFQWNRNLSCFEDHIHRPLGHKIQENFKEYVVGARGGVLWSGKYGILYIKLQLIKLKCVKLSQTFHA